MRQKVYPVNTKPLGIKINILLLPLLFPIQALFAQPTSLPPEMVYVRGGTFEMGCTAEQSANGACDSDEFPVHEVTLTDFYIGKYEVAQAQWTAVVPEYEPNYSQFGQGDNYPVYYISWYDAVTFCNRLSEQEDFRPAYYVDAGLTEVFDELNGNGQVYLNVYWDKAADGYRLLTEAEWEYAARGGQCSEGYVYSGNGDLNSVGWYFNNSDHSTHPVGEKAPNELGVYDMSGNVYELCWDWWGSSYSGQSEACDPSGTTGGSYRVLRGGSFVYDVSNCRVANRGFNTPGNRNVNLGFRVARRL